MGREPEKKHIGKIFGKLKIIDQIKGKKSICQCECGKIKIIATGNLIFGHTKSCGCLSSINRFEYDEDMKKKLLSHIDIKENGCWEWNRSRHKQGYGHFGYKMKTLLAHRVSWMIFKGELSHDIYVCHKCDNPPCVNPDHLFLGTNRDNIIDSIEKGRKDPPKGEKNGSSQLSEENVIEIRRLYEIGENQKSLAKKFKTTRGHIGNIVHRRCWKHL